MARIYTRTGDDGTTGLIGGKRVPKDDERIDAYGAVDELNAVFGLVRSHPLPDRVEKLIERIQDDLFTLGANLALPPDGRREPWKIPEVREADILFLESEIDGFESELPALREFILPGGSAQGALLHLARTVARRAERRCVTLTRSQSVDSAIIRYLNRLSDLCFVLARWLNRSVSRIETNPTFGARREEPG